MQSPDGYLLQASFLLYSSTLEIEVTCSSERSVEFQWTTDVISQKTELFVTIYFGPGIGKWTHMATARHLPPGNRIWREEHGANKLINI
jgi:hypothetical protein